MPSSAADDYNPAGESEPIRVLPADEHNRTLVGHVHPPSWVNPEPRGRYHLVAIGGGTAGLVSAAGAAGLGARTALIERGLLGGDCLNVGCVPSKGVISSARAWHTVKTAHQEFGAARPAGTGDFAAAMERMRRLRAKISHHDSAERFAGLGVDIYLGGGRFLGPDTIEVGGKKLKFRRAVVATGGRAQAPPIAGLSDVDYLTNETVFSLTDLPRRLGVIGAGPIGVEMGQSFARFGSDVTVFEMGNHILPREDADAAAIVQDAMLRDGVNLVFRASVTGVFKRGDQIAVTYDLDGSSHETVVDELLVAVGRAPNIEGLGLEEAGIDTSRHGVVVDDRLRTTNKRVYACGDVASRFKFTHTADAQARIVIQNALFFGRAKASALVVPWCTYTSPEIAHVGMYERDAIERGLEVSTITIPFSDVDRAVLDGEEDGFVRIHHEAGKDRVLGATIVAAHAGDMIGELSLAITHGVGLNKLSSTIHPYPTQAEAIRKAGDAYRRTGLTPRVRKLFDFWFRLSS